MIDQNTTIEELINQAIESLGDGENFTAFDISTAVHELIRHKNIRTIIHDLLRQNQHITKVSDTHNTQGTTINAISYTTKKPAILIYDRIIFNKPIASKNDDRFFLLIPESDDMLVLTRDYYDYASPTVLATYYVKNNQLDVSSRRILDYFGGESYEIFYEDDEIILRLK